MKSSQLQNISLTSAAPRIRLPRSRAALFAAALAMGIGVSSVIAQGPYYPGNPVVPPVGTGTPGSLFDANGTPITTSQTLNFIESKLPATVTLFPYAWGTKTTTATTAQYNAAVQSAAAALAAAPGGTIGTVSIGSLAQVAATYRASVPGQVNAALSALATGISTSGALAADKQTYLERLAFNAAKADPTLLNSITTVFSGIFNVAAADSALVGGIGSLAREAIRGALNTTGSLTPPADMTASATPRSALVQTYGIKSVIGDAITRIGGSLAIGATTPAQKSALIYGTLATVTGDPLVKNSPINLDAAAAGFTSPGSITPANGTNLFDLLTNLNTAAGGGAGATDDEKVKQQAIVQGTLRADAGGPRIIQLKNRFLATTHAGDLVRAYEAFTGSGLGGSLALTYEPAAVAAAGELRYGLASIVKDVLNSALPLPPEASEIIQSGVRGNPGLAAAIAAAAWNQGGGVATAALTTTAVVTAGPVASAGAIAKQVLTTATLAGTNINDVADAAIRAAADAQLVVANKQEAYADIGNNLGVLLKTATGPQNEAAVQALILAAEAKTPGLGYIPATAQMAGSVSPALRVTINAKAQTLLVGDDASAVAKAKALLDVLYSSPVINYQNTFSSATSAANDSERRAVLYAAVLANPSDSAGTLAASIIAAQTPAEALTNTTPALAQTLIAAAVSANRAQQTTLTIAGDVAIHMTGFSYPTSPGSGTDDLQAYLGAQYIRTSNAADAITAAATAVAPKFSHVIAHALAFNQPTTAYSYVKTIYTHSLITYPGKVNDHPAAAAAITAGLTSGILENTVANTLSPAATKTALSYVVGNTVETLLDTAYNDVRIIGATPGTQVLAGSNKGKDFRRTNGLAGGFYASGTTNAYVPAVAGGVTGFVAQIVKDGDKGLGGTGIASGGTADPSAVGTIAAALASATTSASHFTGQAYLLDIAQAAAQAFGWVSHSTLATVGLTAPSEIVLAIYNAYPVDGIGNVGGAFGTKLLNAANFGFTEANGGGVGAKPGAGAEGLRDGPTHPYYDHHSASGTPVSNIFNL